MKTKIFNSFSKNKETQYPIALSMKEFKEMINSDYIQELLGNSLVIIPMDIRGRTSWGFLACKACGKTHRYSFYGKETLIEDIKNIKISNDNCSFCNEYMEHYLEKFESEKLEAKKSEEKFLSNFKIGDRVTFVERFTDISMIDNPINPPTIRTGEIRNISFHDVRIGFGEHGYHYPKHRGSLTISILDDNSLTNLYIECIHQVLSKLEDNDSSIAF